MLQDDAVIQKIKSAVTAKVLSALEEIKKKDAKKAAARKLDLDLGKVGALLRANWSIKEIAKEMNCSEQTIYNHRDEALSLVNNNQEVKS